MIDAEWKVDAAPQVTCDLLTSKEYQTVGEFNRTDGEWGLAVETLADFLGEKEAILTVSQYGLIEDAFLSMGLNDQVRLGFLRKQVRPTA